MDDISIITLHQAQAPTNGIAKSVGVNESTMRVWSKLFCDAWELSHHTTKAIQGRCMKHHIILFTLKCEVNANLYPTAHMLVEQNPHLLYYVLLELSSPPTQSPWLLQPLPHQASPYTEPYTRWDASRWQRMVWSDEAIFRMTDKAWGNMCQLWESHQLDPKYAYRTAEHLESLMVWGTFTFFLIGEIVVLPPIEVKNQNNYLELF